MVCVYPNGGIKCGPEEERGPYRKQYLELNLILAPEFTYIFYFNLANALIDTFLAFFIPKTVIGDEINLELKGADPFHVDYHN